MMKSEFCEMTGIQYETLSEYEYRDIENAYMEFPGDKREFCEEWMKASPLMKDYIIYMVDTILTLRRGYKLLNDRHQRVKEHWERDIKIKNIIRQLLDGTEE